MSFKTNPQILRNYNSWFLEVPLLQFDFFRQNFTIYTYINNFLISNSKKLINYSSKVNTKVWFIWLTYYNYICFKYKTRPKKNYSKYNFNLLYHKQIYLPYKIYLQKQSNVLRFFTKMCSRIIKKKLNTLRNFYSNKIKIIPPKITLVKKKILFFRNKRKMGKKIQAILKSSILNLQLAKFIIRDFDIDIEFYSKNIKSSLKNSARRLNKILFKQLYFLKQFKILKDTIYILNISTYCKSSYFFSEHLITQLCKLRKQWSIINITTQIISKIIKIRINIQGCKILISGRLQGRDRKKTFVKVFGLLPLHIFSTNISYSLSQDYNIFGMFGVKVWLYYL